MSDFKYTSAMISKARKEGETLFGSTVVDDLLGEISDLRAQLEAAKEENKQLRTVVMTEMTKEDLKIQLADMKQDRDNLQQRFTAPIVCMCGSTKFKQAWVSENARLTLAGNIVLSVGMFAHADGQMKQLEDNGSKIRLDDLHKRKIDLCDWVWVLDLGGYIGNSTKSEIAYAEKLGKPIRYLSQEFPEYVEPVDNLQAQISHLEYQLGEACLKIAEYERQPLEEVNAWCDGLRKGYTDLQAAYEVVRGALRVVNVAVEELFTACPEEAFDTLKANTRHAINLALSVKPPEAGERKESYTDEQGIIWNRPTAEAHVKICKQSNDKTALITMLRNALDRMNIIDSQGNCVVCGAFMLDKQGNVANDNHSPSCEYMQAISITPLEAGERVRGLVEALEELIDIVQGVIDGDAYNLDWFTLQPARIALDKYRGGAAE
ncbi:hypothetical protein [Sporomusa aerivorans]|uniref:hypothetical protein n=1 Tax=Sporomusa aerivorans TaxID=204936 RepID=UPI00352A37B6